MSADSLKQMFTEYPEATHEGQLYGYGVVISRLKFGKLLYYHGGGVKGIVEPRFVQALGASDHIASDLFGLPLSSAH